jgi:cell division ATPase FtsA
LTQEVNKPYFSTAVGLALYGLKNGKDSSFARNGASNESDKSQKSTIFSKIIDFFKKM